MVYKMLYIFVENKTEKDKLFIERIINPYLEKKYAFIHPPYQYAEQGKDDILDYLKSINSMMKKNTADYLYFLDADFRNLKGINKYKEEKKCITKIKTEEEDKYRKGESSLLCKDNIIVVIEEIESWYLAGLNQKTCEELEIKYLDNTDTLTKEEAMELIPKKYKKYYDENEKQLPAIFIQEILNNFDVETAKKKNKSFNYFFSKYCC